MSKETQPRRLKIIGSYATFGTRIIDCDTGLEIHGVTEITWIHKAGELPTCTIELANVTLESEADLISVPPDLAK